MRAGLAVGLAIAATGCAVETALPDDLEIPPLVFDQRGIREHVPALAPRVDFSWTAMTTSHLTADIVLVTPSGVTVSDFGTRPFASGRASWTPTLDHLPGFYHYRAAVLDEDGLQRALVTSPGIEVVQGVELPPLALTFAGGGPHEVSITVSTLAVLTIELAVIRPADGARFAFARAAVASDLAPIARFFAWRGRDLDGGDIPAGDYDLVADVTTDDGAVRYRNQGETLRWSP